MQKILYILEDGRLGGMSKMVLEIASGIKEVMETKIIIGKKDSEAILLMEKGAELDIKVLDIKFLSKNPKLIATFSLWFITDLFKLIKEIIQYNPDLVYCNGSQHIKGVIAAKLLGKKVIWHMHDTFQPKAIVALFKIVKSLFGVKYFAASSLRTIDFYNLPEENTLLSIPPVNTSNFSPEIRSVHVPPSKSFFNIISVSNVNPDKGLDTLIYTAAEVNKTRNDICFKIVGLIPETQRALYNELISLAKKLNVHNIEFLGQRNDVHSILSSTDIYLCCSNNESGPIAVFEAMAMQVPIVSTNVGDLEKIFSINNSARVQPIKDSSALAREILFLLDNPSIMNGFAKRGRVTAVQHLDTRISIRNHLNFYNQLLLT